MTIPDWTKLIEPDKARQARKLAAKFTESSGAQSIEAYFWNRNDLVYIGDFEWAQAGYEGCEYIADIEARGSGGFHYIYGFVALKGQTQVAQTLVCEVRNHASEPHSFGMLIAGEWQPGPLSAWLDSLRPDVQMIASERYQNLVRWVRSTI